MSPRAVTRASHIMVIAVLTASVAAVVAASFHAADARSRPNRNSDIDHRKSLYSYHRTEDEVTRIDVGQPVSDAPAISPRIFSNFLEHLGGAVYDGLWANAIQNPQFAADRRGTLANWRLRDGARWEEGGIRGKRATLVPGARVTQLVSLPVHRQFRYRASLWCRALADSSATLEISIRRSDKPSVIASARIAVGADSQSRAVMLAIPADSIARGESAELEIRCVAGDSAVDMVELFPADSVSGVDPDVLRAAKDLHIELLRWPGGNFVSGYHWRDGVGPRELRPTVPNPAWGGLETHHFGTDEFLAFCRRIGAKPQIAVNAGNGTPDEAAAWVEYCNGSVDSPMGRIRAQNGHPEPYNVRVWEIGNELYGDWQIGHVDATGNAQRFVRFRDAMLRADPTIEIIATGKGDEFVGAGLRRDEDWNRNVLAAAVEGRHSAPQYLSLHPLVPLPGDLGSKYTYDEVYASSMAHPHWWSTKYVPALMAQIATAEGGEHTRLAVTEWGIIVGGPSWLRYPNHNAQSGAVYAALFFNAMLRRADAVGLSNVTALMHGGGIKRPNSRIYLDPMYYVEQIYGAARPERELPITVAGPGYDVPQRGFLPAVEDVPWLDAFAASRGFQKMLFVVNRDPEQSRTCEIHLRAHPKSLACETLAATPRQGNSPAKPNAVAPHAVQLESDGRVLRHAFPPCSVTIIRWR